MIEALIHWDEQWFSLINQSGTSFWDPIMLFITHKFSWIPLYLFLIYLLFMQQGKKAWWTLLAVALVVTCLDQSSVHLFKNHFERLRPCHFLDNVRLVTEGCGGLYGFVSSHATNAFGLAVFFGKLLQKKNAFPLLFLWAAIVAYSRVYVGVHYPLDILGGMLWGTFVALVLFQLYQLLYKKYVR